ncbi:phosphatidate cytidylyltransferase [Acidiphilium sp. AL]|uniref:Phosphatidate cytidylyltransferase n=1 Tax=Acidiphilium iwatense TaxID=768198 RepID=A0ABS9DXP3_9PROT|nr:MULTISPECIES: phosphatidate cytidylyltransferase [Acidiphilium]MCF3947458.1 phosphatidate cytidylyltransferase [Acidiphilium iwatense]MCU4160697.1 phosphatidate cytidylyltransferase [Acidiphilium sp. AL]
MSAQLAESPPRSTNRFHDLGIRTASAAVLIPLAVAALILGGWAWRLLILAFLAGLLWEWRALSRHVAAPNRKAFAVAGLAYAGLPAIALLWLRFLPHGPADILFLLVVVWATDIGAYAAGRLIGGAKLAPAVSPGKTISGAIGGLAIGILAGVIIARGPSGILPAALLSAVSQAGDLAESALKRRLGVKDSGRTIPGHGGLFDRLDGVLAAAPIAAGLALLAQGGVPLWR